MSDLAPEDRALLELAREAHEPTAAARSRVRAALIAQLGVSTGLTAAAAASSSSAAAAIAAASGTAAVASAGGAAVASAGGAAVATASTTLVLAVKVLSAVAIAGAAVSGGVAAHRSLREREPKVPMTASAQIPAAPGPVAGSAPNDPAPSKPAISSAPGRESLRTAARWREPSPIPTLPDPPSPRASPTKSPTPAPQEPPKAEATAAPALSQSEVAVFSGPLSPTTLEAETRLVRAGIAALHEHDPARALALFDEHARLYPLGTLAEERAAARVNALCDLGQADRAQAAAAAFLRDRPSSPLAARVRAACMSPHGARTNP